MSRSYRHIKEYENEIIELKSQGVSFMRNILNDRICERALKLPNLLIPNNNHSYIQPTIT